MTQAAKKNRDNPAAFVRRLCGLVAALLAICFSANADTTLFTSAFQGNGGAAVLSGNADNTSGTTSLTINDWTNNAAVTSISGLTAISTPTPAGGFAVLQNGTATYANTNCVFVNCNLNVNQSTCQRGYSFTFTINSSFNLTALTVAARHTSNTGNLAQQYTSDLHYSISGGTLGTPLAGFATETYPLAPQTNYTVVPFSLGNASIGAGTYTVQVFMTNLVSGGAYATYQGITLAGNPPNLTLAPTFSPVPGNYAGGQTVTISSATPGATIYYTTDGSAPTTSSPNGITPVTVVLPANTNLTIHAFAQLSGYTASGVASAAYSTYTNLAFTWINPAGGNWSGGANWSNNDVANGVGLLADFSKLSLSGNATVALDIPVTVGSLTFGDQANANSWTLANGGVGPLTLNNGTNTSVILVSNQTTTISALLAGTNGLVKTGPGTLVLTNANTFTKGTVVNGGTLALDYNVGDNPTGTLAGGNPVTVNANGTLRLDVEDVLGYNGGIPSALNINGGFVTSADVANTTSVQNGGTSFRVTLPTVNFTGGTLSSGVNNQGDNYGGSYLIGSINTFSNAATAVINAYSISLTGSATFTVAAGNTPSGVDLDVSSTLRDWFDNPPLTKAGAGFMELDQNVTPYNSAVNVNGGTLFLNGTLGTGGVNVAANAKFLGAGSLNGPITVASGGTLGVGYTNLNMLSSYSTLTFNSGSTNYMKISKNGNSAQSDQFQNLQSVTFAGTLVVSNITSDSSPLAANDSFQLYPYAVAYHGSFSSVVLPTLPVGLGWDVSQLGSGIITVSSSAAPPTFSPPAGGYAGALTVTISSLTPGATIYYTIDGSTPTTSSPSGITPVQVLLPANTNITIQAFAQETGYSASSVQSAAYSTYANYVWISPTGGAWSTTANWSNNAVANGVGTPADFSKLTLSGSPTVSLDIPATVGSLVFGDQANANGWTLADGGAGPLTLNNATNAPVIVVSDQSTTISAVLAGSAGFVKTGSGTLVLDNANVNSGPLVVSNGTVALNYNPGDGPTGTLAAGTTNTVNAGGKLLMNVEDVMGYGGGSTAQLNINGGLVTSADVSTNTTVQNGGPSFRVTLPPVTFSGGTLSSGTNNEGDNYGGSYLMSSVNTFSNATTAVINAYKISIIAGSSSVFNVAAGSTPSGVDLSVSSILINWGGNFNLTKNGNGVMTLSGANTYSGNTTINGGKLGLAGSGSISNSPSIIIAGGATFDVSGLNSPFILGASQTLANNGSTALFNGNGSAVTGTLSLNYTNGIPALTVGNGTLTLSSSTVFQINNTGSQLPGGTYTLISTVAGGAVAGTVPTGAITVGGGGAASTATLAIAGGQLNLVVASSVNTNPTNITATASSGNLNLSWPADHLGWTLQTNSVGLAASNQWFAYPGSTSVTNVSLSIDHTKTNVFFRMYYP